MLEMKVLSVFGWMLWFQFMVKIPNAFIYRIIIDMKYCRRQIAQQKKNIWRLMNVFVCTILHTHIKSYIVIKITKKAFSGYFWMNMKCNWKCNTLFNTEWCEHKFKFLLLYFGMHNILSTDTHTHLSSLDRNIFRSHFFLASTWYDFVLVFYFIFLAGNGILNDHHYQRENIWAYRPNDRQSYLHS